MPTQLCVSLTGCLAEHSEPPKLGVLLSSRLGKQASVSSADTGAAAINTAKLLSTDGGTYLDTGKSCNTLAIRQEEPKQIMIWQTALASQYPRVSKQNYFKTLLCKMLSISGLSSQSVSLKIRSYAIETKDNCKLTEML